MIEKRKRIWITVAATVATKWMRKHRGFTYIYSGKSFWKFLRHSLNMYLTLLSRLAWHSYHTFHLHWHSYHTFHLHILDISRTNIAHFSSYTRILIYLFFSSLIISVVSFIYQRFFIFARQPWITDKWKRQRWVHLHYAFQGCNIKYHFMCMWSTSLVFVSYTC